MSRHLFSYCQNPENTQARPLHGAECVCPFSGVTLLFAVEMVTILQIAPSIRILHFVSLYKFLSSWNKIPQSILSVVSSWDSASAAVDECN